MPGEPERREPRRGEGEGRIKILGQFEWAQYAYAYGESVVCSLGETLPQRERRSRDRSHKGLILRCIVQHRPIR